MNGYDNSDLILMMKENLFIFTQLNKLTINCFYIKRLIAINVKVFRI